MKLPIEGTKHSLILNHLSLKLITLFEAEGLADKMVADYDGDWEEEDYTNDVIVLESIKEIP